MVSGVLKGEGKVQMYQNMDLEFFQSEILEWRVATRLRQKP